MLNNFMGSVAKRFLNANDLAGLTCTTGMSALCVSSMLVYVQRPSIFLVDDNANENDFNFSQR
jgi:hypothetical protein